MSYMSVILWDSPPGQAHQNQQGTISLRSSVLIQLKAPAVSMTQVFPESPDQLHSYSQEPITDHLTSFPRDLLVQELRHADPVWLGLGGFSKS